MEGQSCPSVCLAAIFVTWADLGVGLGFGLVHAASQPWLIWAQNYWFWEMIGPGIAGHLFGLVDNVKLTLGLDLTNQNGLWNMIIWQRCRDVTGQVWIGSAVHWFLHGIHVCSTCRLNRVDPRFKPVECAFIGSLVKRFSPMRVFHEATQSPLTASSADWK